MLIDTSGRLGKSENDTEQDKQPFAEHLNFADAQGARCLYKKAICDLMDRGLLSVHFQPIFSANEGIVYGYEALTRITPEVDHPFSDIGDLFRKAREADMISSLDLFCRRNAMRYAALLGMKERGAYLFINVCPETLICPDHGAGITGEIAEKWGLPKDRIIIEITEELSLENYRLFMAAIHYYREQGYKIAIDDFGSGLGGLKMLSAIGPDFVKIDRHLISGIDKNMLNFSLVESIATACHRIGIRVVAEGVEQQEELDFVLNMGFEFFQGYLPGKPSPSLAINEDIFTTVTRIKTPGRASDRNAGRHFDVIGNICRSVDPVGPGDRFVKAVNRFTIDPVLRGLPVVENGTVLGMLHRTRFTEQQMIGRFGYGMYLNSYKNVCDVMEGNFLLVEANASLEDVAQRVNSREAACLYDDLIVTSHGKYMGTVAVSDLLEAMTERSISAAQNSNPLTGLPGNLSIQKEVEKLLSQNVQFDVCYIDLDNFKPFNDCYGFERGDLVIKGLANIIVAAVDAVDKNIFNFVGHIGGDDFILIARSQISVHASEKIITDFLAKLPEFHGAEDFARGSYISKNRKGEIERFDLLSLSIGIVSTEVRKIDSYAQFSSIATEVKKLAKMQKGPSIVRDRRKDSGPLPEDILGGTS